MFNVWATRYHVGKITRIIKSRKRPIINQHFLFSAWYWRDFAGVIPKDALPGGKDDDGNAIYIGQVLHNDCLIPAKIYENDRQAHYPYNGVENSISKNVKV